MKALILILVLFTTQAHARNFLHGTIALQATYSTLETGTQTVATIPAIGVNVSDDGLFCELHYGGKIYACHYHLGGERCDDESIAIPATKSDPAVHSEDYNCDDGESIGIGAITLDQLLRATGFSPVLQANLDAKMAIAMGDYKGRRIKPNLYFGNAYTDGAIPEGTQIHDEVHPDSFHVKTYFTEKLVQF